jgi:hypothetical protein
LLQKRKNLKLIVASATVDAEQLYNFFNLNSSRDITKDTAVIMSVEGRLYPVDIHYVKGNILHPGLHKVYHFFNQSVYKFLHSLKSHEIIGKNQVVICIGLCVMRTGKLR